MKNQRTHRRKLHFNSAKVVAPVVTVEAEGAPKRPIQRRKRQPRSRRISPAPVRPALPATTWRDIQEHFAAAKSLGEITRTTLQFFQEHEGLQGSSPVFPIFVPSSEIYKMKVSRKRRIYDVLHVLEGIGVIKRVRCGDTRQTKGGFLYYGKAGVVQHLAEMQRNAAQVMVNIGQTRGLSSGSTVEEDRALIQVFEDQATAKKWPCLVNMTVCFLGLLFQQDCEVGIALSRMSARLAEAKKFMVPPLWDETSYRDVHRRVYDVVSVLVSCNLIIISVKPITTTESSPNKGNPPRKLARFNYDIFTDPRVLFASYNAETERSDPIQEKLLGRMDAAFSAYKDPTPKGLENHFVSPPSTGWQSLQAGTPMITSPKYPQVATVRVSDADSDGPLLSKTKGAALRYDASTARCRPEAQQGPRVYGFFSPLGREPTEKNEWYDESLKQLGLYDALPTVDKVDWELNSQIEEASRGALWGSPTYLHVEVPPKQLRVDSVEVKPAVDDHATITANFFC